MEVHFSLLEWTNNFEIGTVSLQFLGQKRPGSPLFCLLSSIVSITHVDLVLYLWTKIGLVILYFGLLLKCKKDKKSALSVGKAIES